MEREKFGSRLGFILVSAGCAIGLGPQEAIELLNRRVHPGAVILLHSTSETNCEILQELIRGWKAQGYTFATLDDLCAGE